MGITLGKLQLLRTMNLLPDAGRILDIGSSNLYAADTASLARFAESFGRTLDEAALDRIADGSIYGAGVTRNASFVGDLLEQLGLEYLAFDIADGYHTRIFDLNAEQLSPRDHGRFDTVLNFGTTEHVFNQLNAFRVIHDAVKVGGHIVHQLPTNGYIDHGYFCYTPRFFFDLAGHNYYDLIDFTYDEPSAGSDMFQILKDYAALFPVLKRYEDREACNVRDLALSIVLRKTRDAPLRLPLERSTSVVIEPARRIGARLYRKLLSFTRP